MHRSKAAEFLRLAESFCETRNKHLVTPRAAIPRPCRLYVISIASRDD
jgi:hypothetical protein